MNILNNPWVIGIGGGVISSLIVFFVTQYISRKKGKREYLQKIKMANNDILYFIRPLIIERKIPTLEIISAIKFSIAKKYGIKEADLYSEVSLYNDLVTEIMANSFLSSEQKLDFCDLLKQIKEKALYKENSELATLMGKNIFSSKLISILFASISFTMVLTTTLFMAAESDMYTLESNESINFILLCVATIIPILMMLVTTVYKDLYKFKIKKSAIQSEKCQNDTFK